ncbi:MAG: SURF1 family protein, partial [Planktomarina sp.]|nr:SURF1 family protein [Planktomarina sp.]
LLEDGSQLHFLSLRFLMRKWGMILVGILGVAVLLSLTVWQIKRMAWKNNLLSKIEIKISSPVVEIPQGPSKQSHGFLPVKAYGRFLGRTLKVLVSQKIYGAGYRLITAFELQDGRRVLIDRGFISVSDTMPIVPKIDGMVIGNLHWPKEIDSFTPENDLKNNIWFARDVPTMAKYLDTEPVLLILKSSDLDQENIMPLPVDTAGIPNNHLQYAITWFLLSLIWLGMSGYFVYRSRDAKT